MTIRRLFVSTLMTAIAALTFTSAVMAQGTTVVVTPTNMQGWSTADTRLGGEVNFIVDSSSPAPIGALQLTTNGTTTAKAQYLHQANTPLEGVTELGYYTKQVSAPFLGADPSYQLPVCLGGFVSPVTPMNPTGCTGFTTFVFEPYQNNGLGTPSPVVVNGLWQQWDVAAGQFWSSRTASDGGTCNVIAGGGGPPFYSLASLKVMCPDAVVVGFGVNIGSNNPSYNVETDLVKFNDTTYDFEPYRVAATRDDCKNGGYLNVKRADGTSFRNQGQCVSYVESTNNN